MKIGIIHLSDLHISDDSVVHIGKVNALLRSSQVLYPLDGVIIAFSGDIAAHGQKNEYKLAERFIGALCDGIIQKYGIEQNNIKVLIAPGNHDMNRKISPQVDREMAEKWHNSRKIGTYVPNEIARMQDFYAFADGEKCFFVRDPQPFTRKVLVFNNQGQKYYIEANIFNSALFSGDNDIGIHHMPASVYGFMNIWSPAQFSISIMHHSPEWFWPEEKVRLQEEIYKRSNLVFYGHEHYESVKRTILNNGKLTLVQAGGAWWELEDKFANSSYYIGSFDTETRKYQQYCFEWNSSREFYEHKDFIEEILPNKYVGSAELTPKANYIKNILVESKVNVCSDFTKYFIFPTLQPIESGEYNIDGELESEEELIKIIESTPQIMIIGDHNSGKSTLLRHLFLQLINNYTVLLCEIPDISGKKQHNIIKEVFTNIYGSDPAAYHLFEQQEISKKIILIDDTNEIEPEHLAKLLSGLQAHFSHIIMTSKKDTTFDVQEQISSMLDLDHSICQLAISKFYADKRTNLIDRLVAQLNDSPKMSNEELSYKIDKALDLQNLNFKLEPEFIVEFTTYYCNHINELRNEDINVFSKVFEASIELAIQPYIFRETVGQIKTALSEVAYFIHFHKEYPISEDGIASVVKQYAENYDEEITVTRFIQIVTKAKILRKSSADLNYSFRNKDYLAYFVASALSRHFNEDHPDAEKDLAQVVDESCFSINPTILKYIAYSTENIKIIKLLLTQAVEYVKDWGIYDIDNHQFTYLKSISESPAKTITGGEKARAVGKRVESEKALEEKEFEAISTIGIYDYDVEDVWKINNQLIRATLQMQVIASSLPTFSHIMPGSIKRELILALYTMPNKIFFQWGSAVDETIEDMIKAFSEQQFEEGRGYVSEDDVRKIRSAMQKMSTGLLLNLYYSVARHSATLATIHNICRLDGDRNSNQRLEQLMFYEEVDDWSTFIKEAEALYKETKNPMVKNMVKLMVYHILVWSPTLPLQKRHHLMDTFRFKKDSKLYLI